MIASIHSIETTQANARLFGKNQRSELPTSSLVATRGTRKPCRPLKTAPLCRFYESQVPHYCVLLRSFDRRSRWSGDRNNAIYGSARAPLSRQADLERCAEQCPLLGAEQVSM